MCFLNKYSCLLINIWKIIITKLVVLWTEFKIFLLLKAEMKKKDFFVDNDELTLTFTLHLLSCVLCMSFTGW